MKQSITFITKNHKTWFKIGNNMKQDFVETVTNYEFFSFDFDSNNS